MAMHLSGWAFDQLVGHFTCLSCPRCHLSRPLSSFLWASSSSSLPFCWPFCTSLPLPTQCVWSKATRTSSGTLGLFLACRPLLGILPSVYVMPLINANMTESLSILQTHNTIRRAHLPPTSAWNACVTSSWSLQCHTWSWFELVSWVCWSEAVISLSPGYDPSLCH